MPAKMMKLIDLEELRSTLLSDDLEKQIPALDQACTLVQEIITITIQMLENGRQRFLVAERLHRLGPSAIEPLQSLLVRSNESEVKILVSLVLLQLGSKVGVDELLQALVIDRDYVVLIARHLAKSQIYESVDRIISRLRIADSTEIDLIVGLLDALVELRVEVPGDLLNHFAQPSMPWQIRRTAAEIISRQSSAS